MKRKGQGPHRERGRVKRTALLLVAATLLAGCTASGGEDPWAYTKRELYSGGFDLAKVAAREGATDSQEFRVTDGSIGAIRLLVWVNATAGAPTVTINDPSGRTIVQTSETIERQAGLALGAWTVRVDSPPGTEGRVHILVVRG